MPGTCLLKCIRYWRISRSCSRAWKVRWGDVVSLVQYATDIEQFMATGDIRKQFFTARFPVTTTIQVGRLYHPDLLIEITAVAEIPRERFHRP